ncbi:hypothetical protein EPUS_00894 [Endocarpon pusillum Z07020]|uniref:MIND kinetochore complex component Nnf1 n=1 Tax=Endocarpon pusillum (strain Z07020 / HMAS-L-300199) TaxID=1263415 RepID=U1GNZ9_ENDPU|nr:uncharacterized protein EPUS_00894 [Endocarpon pusillum Z07020]ERF73641.1 hypothetical protein EPUS_00894 [Endocarpon pusillum Z07020]
MPPRNSRSPSPPPSLPIASSPGPRFLALQKIFTQALTSTLKTSSYANFSKCFPTPAQHCPTALEGVWKQLNAKLEEGCMKEFEAIVFEKKVIEGLNGWDAVVEDAKRRIARGVEGEEVHRAPHTLSVEELHIAHLTPYLQQATTMLEARLKDTQEENGTLMRRITEQRVEMENLVQGLEGVVADLEDSIEAMRDDGEGGVDGLRAEIWEMEGEMRGRC